MRECKECGQPYWFFHSKKECQRHWWISDNGIMHMKPKRLFESPQWKKICEEVEKIRIRNGH